MGIFETLGLIQGIIGANRTNARARRLEQEGMDLQNAALRQVMDFDAKRRTEFDRLDQAGTFNPQSQISALRNLRQAILDIQTKNLAGATKMAGYRPGDASLAQTLRSVSAKEARQTALEEANLRRNAALARISAMNAAYTPTSQSLLAGIGSQRTQIGLGSGSDPSLLLGQYMANGGLDWLLPKKSDAKKISF
jgi:ribonuclease D